MKRRRRRWREVDRRLPDPMLCRIFIQTAGGVVIAKVVGDFLRRPFHKKTGGLFWTSWRPLTAAELRLVLR